MSTQPDLFTLPRGPLSGYTPSEARALAVRFPGTRRFMWVVGMRWLLAAWSEDIAGEPIEHPASSGVIMAGLRAPPFAVPDLLDGTTVRLLAELAGLDSMDLAHIHDALELTTLCAQPQLERMDTIRRQWKAWRRRCRADGVAGSASGLRPFVDAHGYGFREAYVAIRGAL